MQPSSLPTVRRRPRPQRGVTTLITLVISAATLTIVASLLAVTTSQLRMTQKQDNKLRALMLAESGVDLAVQQLTASSSWTGTGNSPVTLYQNPTANVNSQIALGTVAVTVTGAGTNLYRVDSTGTNSNGTTAKVNAIIQSTGGGAGTYGASVSLGRYALLAKNDISIGGTPNIYTSPLNQHNADCFADRNLSMNGNPTVDGSVKTVGTQTYVGVPSVYGGRTTGVPAISFPTEATLTSWDSTWLASAKTGTTYNSNTLLPSNKSNVTIATPCYINGNLSIGSQQSLTITGTGVCYVDGSVDIQGQGALTNSGLLVVKNGLSQAGNNYVASPVAGQKMATVVCLNGGFSLRGTVTHAGIIYTARGTISVAGNTTFTGALVAGVDISAQGNYTQYFPGGMDSPIAFTQAVSANSFSVVNIIEP